MKIKKYFIFLTILFAVLSFLGMAENVSALPLPKPLEVNYPDLPGGDTPTPATPTTPFIRYAEYVFYFLVWGSGILALLALIYAGFLYITAVGNPDKLRDARDRIFSALLGLAIVLGSYAILWQINPKFLVFELQDLDPLINTLTPGVLACKTAAPVQDIWLAQNTYRNLSDITAKRAARLLIDNYLLEINKNCYYITEEGNIKAEFNDQIKKIYFVPNISYEGGNITSVLQYGAAVFSDNDYKGLGLLFLAHLNPFSPLSLNPLVTEFSNPEQFQLKISSIKPFKQKYFATASSINWRVRLYREVNENAGLADADQAFFDKFAIEQATEYFSMENFNGTLLMYPKPITSLSEITSPKSMRIDGSPLIVLFKGLKQGAWNGEEQEFEYEVQPTTIGAGDNAETGFYFQVFFKSEDNLVAYRNLVRWGPCESYEAVQEYCSPDYDPDKKTGINYAYPCCAKAASNGIIILSNIIPL